MGGKDPAFRNPRVRQGLACFARARGNSGRGGRRRRAIRIAVLSPAWFPVPPTRYGGIEAVVSLLADGLVEAGHDVTLFASGDSKSPAKLVSAFSEAPSSRIGTASADLLHALTCLERADDFDVINDHSGPLAAAVGCATDTPVVHTVHGPLGGEPGVIYQLLANASHRLNLISISMNQRNPKPDLPWVANCPNALDLGAYSVGDHDAGYLLFLGRMCAEKGAHRAIEIARAAGLPLKLAGKKQDVAEREYFDKYVAQGLGGDIEYLGEVSQSEKLELLQDARATLFPIEWEEPFGLVMIESMACGTPVIATRRGAVPEVVGEGRGGIIVERHSEMVGALAEAEKIDPADCRRYVEEKFSAARMVADYVAAYEGVTGGRERPAPELVAPRR
jgi:glycosyltransferase involved in cell wall biosynthesis